MEKLPFADKFGRMTYCDGAQAFVREKGYIIIKKGAEIMCGYDADSEIFYLLDANKIELDAEPTISFSVLSYLYENNRPIKEKQKYRLYVVKDADLKNIPLHWCKLEDIVLKNISFDATQLIGIKNMLVRMNEYEKNL